MKLAFCLFKYYPYGGLEQSFLNITRQALACGHEVHVFTRSWQGEQPHKLHVHIIKSRGFNNHSKCKNYVTQLQVRLAKETFDLIVGFNRMPGLDLYYNADVSFVAEAQQKHGKWYQYTPRYKIFSQFEHAVFSPQSPTHIMFISHAAKNSYQAIYNTPEQRFHALPAGLNKEKIRASVNPETRSKVRQLLNLSDQDTLLLMIGSDFKRKGVERSIRALAALTGPLKQKTTLVIIGRGKPTSLEKLADRFGIKQQVKFLGGRSDVPHFLAAADFLLHPALAETAGNAIVEGLVAGLPVLVTRSCGFSYHVEQAQAGIVIDDSPYDQRHFNEALQHALNQTEGQQWRQNAWSYADKVDLYSRPQKAVQIIEQLVTLKKENSQKLL